MRVQALGASEVQGQSGAWGHGRVCGVPGEGANVDEEEASGCAEGILQPGKLGCWC